MIIALGAATVSHADTGITQTGHGSPSAPAPHRPERNQDRMRSYLENYQRRTACTMLLASHHMGEVERMCDDVIMLRAGLVVDQGSPQQLIERYRRETMEEVFLDIARGGAAERAIGSAAEEVTS